MTTALVFSLGDRHPSTRMRLLAYTGNLRQAGWDLRFHHFAAGIGGLPAPTSSRLRRLQHRLYRAWQTADATRQLRRVGPSTPVIICREAPVSLGPFLRAPNPLVVDIDDALYLGPGREKLFRLCRKAHTVVCGNSRIADALQEVAARRVVIPTVVETERYRVKQATDGVGRLGWVGTSHSIQTTLVPWLDALRGTGHELVVIADDPQRFLPREPWIRCVEWSEQIENELADHIDIGAMPLHDEPFQQAKCGAKLLQYMAAGLPAIASPVGVNREIVMDGVTGFLAGSATDWRAALRRLEDAGLRRQLGRAGRERVVRDYSVARWTPDWVRVLEELTA